MTKILKSPKPVLLLGGIACLLLFSACGPSKKITGDVHIDKFINWQIDLKPGISTEQKAAVVLKIDSYIIKQLTNQGVPVSQIKITHNFLTLADHPAFAIEIDLTGPVSTGGFSTVRPRPPGPKRELLNLSPDIQNIRIIDASGNLVEME